MNQRQTKSDMYFRVHQTLNCPDRGFLDDIWALRLSRIIGFVMLYAIGYRWGGYVGRSRFWTGVTMMGIGVAITGVVIALGG